MLVRLITLPFQGINIRGTICFSYIFFSFSHLIEKAPQQTFVFHGKQLQGMQYYITIQMYS